MERRYRIFLDDERFPPADGNWVIIRSYQEFVDYVSNYGMPYFISFDHDLGAEKTGYDIVKWIINQSIDNIITIPSDFNFYVHSQNPIGKENIEKLFQNYLGNREI